MKRAIGILITLIMLFTTTCGICDDDRQDIPFTAGLTSSVVTDNALEVITSSERRAILTVCLAIDFGLIDAGKDYMANNFSLFLINDSYVASDGTFLAVTGYAGGKCLSMFYYPETKEASYFITEVDLSDELMDGIVKNASEKLPISYKNDVAELLKVIDVIKDAIND